MWKDSARKYSFMLIAGLMFAAFLLGCLVLLLAMKDQSEDRLLRYLRDSTVQRQMALRHKVEGNFQTLRGIAAGIVAGKSCEHTPVRSFLSLAIKGNGFKLMGFTHSDGSIDAVDKNGRIVFDVGRTGVSFLSNPSSGENLSGSVPGPIENGNVNFYATPVRRNDETLGLLWAAECASALKNILSVPVLRGTGYFALIDIGADFVVTGADPNPEVRPAVNLFDVADFPQQERERMTWSLAEGVGGNFIFDVDGALQMAAMQPLYLNDWAVVGVVGYRVVLASYYLIAKGAVLLILLACVLFLFLMYSQMRAALKNQTTLEHIAYADPLTGGRNYAKFLADARKILNENPDTHYAVWTFDTKNFDRINSIMGNEKGDRVLQRIYKVLGLEATKDSAHCRISSDIFAGIRPYHAREELETWFWNIIATLARRVVIADSQMRIDDAMGIYCIDDFPQDISVIDMVNRSALARRAAKEHAGNTVLFFSGEMEKKQRWLAELEAGGEKALKNGDFTFFLQPKVSTQGGYAIVGAEALVRWRHPRHGWILPNDFIPLFESNGFIIKLDRYIFEQVCRWLHEHCPITPCDLRVSVNVSRQGIFADDFIRHYTDVKNKYGIGDKALELEFTESVLLDDYDAFRNVVLQLQTNGFACSIDDFGSGYSSLNVLKNLPIDLLKLDARFFHDEGEPDRARIVVDHFVRMAHHLNILTVAEGVETPEQVHFLQDSGCNMVQGYVFSKPLPRDKFERLLKRTGGLLTLQDYPAPQFSAE